MRLTELVAPFGDETVLVPFDGDAHHALREAGWSATVRADDDVLLKPWWCETCQKPRRATQVESASICRTCRFEVRPRVRGFADDRSPAERAEDRSDRHASFQSGGKVDGVDR